MALPAKPDAATAGAETPFDPTAYIKQANENEAAKRPTPGEPGAAAAAEAEAPKLPRSVRRQLNTLLRENGELAGRLKELELKAGSPSAAATAANGATKTPGAGATVEDPEPVRKDFADDATYNRAVGKWDARQEARAAIDKLRKDGDAEAGAEEFMEHVAAMDTQAASDIALIPDWDEVAAAAQDDDNRVEFDPAAHPTFIALLAQSDVKAWVLYHFAQHQGELKAILELTSKPERQIHAFARLEGRIERLYDPEEKRKAAQASQTPGDKGKGKDRTNTPSGNERRTSELDARKPKPSSEVAARGGSAAPEEPPIGSAAWMARRNQQQHGR